MENTDLIWYIDSRGWTCAKGFGNQIYMIEPTNEIDLGRQMYRLSIGEAWYYPNSLAMDEAKDSAQIHHDSLKKHLKK